MFESLRYTWESYFQRSLLKETFQCLLTLTVNWITSGAEDDIQENKINRFPGADHLCTDCRSDSIVASALCISLTAVVSVMYFNKSCMLQISYISEWFIMYFIETSLLIFLVMYLVNVISLSDSKWLMTSLSKISNLKLR